MSGPRASAAAGRTGNGSTQQPGRTRTVVFIAAMGEVHAHNVQARLAQLVNGLDGVGLGANGADDGGPAQVALRLVGRVKLCQPFDLAPEGEMVESRGRHCSENGWDNWFRLVYWLRKVRARHRIQRGRRMDV